MLFHRQRSAGPDELLEGRHRDTTAPMIEVCSVQVERCFIPHDFDDEHPIYLLDFPQAALILYGQWLYDPHTLLCSDAAFEAWDCARSFFSAFEVSYVGGPGDVLSLKVTAPGYVDVEPLAEELRFKRLCACELIPRTPAGLVADLRTAGLIL